MANARTTLDEGFVGPGLDPEVWITSYLPHWSSTEAAAAAWAVDDDGLHLTIPVDHPLWCPDDHDGPLRVSCIQTGTRSGPVGSTDGPQPFRDGLVVREEQPTVWGCTPHLGRIEVRMRATVTPRSMFALWLSGIEDRPERSGEICVAEVFGDAISDGHAEVGMGVHRFRDPALTEEFAPARLAIDVAEPHNYAANWGPDSIEFSVDGDVVRRVDQSPGYPMQLMLGVFDFPDRAPDGESTPPVPELVVEWLTVAPPR